MRVSFCILAALLVTVPALAPTTTADEEPKPLAPDEPAPAPAKPFQPPPFGMDLIAPPEDTTPEGWLVGPLPEMAPSSETLALIAKAAGLDAAKVKGRCQPLMKGDGEGAPKAVAAWFVIDADPTAFTPKLAEAAKKNGWKLKDVGGPARVLVTWGSTEEAAAEIQRWQVEVAVRRLAEKGFEMVASASQEFDRDLARATFLRGQSMIEMAGKTEPEAGIYHALMARLLEQSDPAAALEHNRKALRKDAPVPPPDRWVVIAAFQAGQALLLKMDKAVVDEALAILLCGVAAEEKADSPFQRFGNRYNLACAYARLDDKDKAFEHLAESLRFLKGAWEEDKKKDLFGTSSLDYPSHFLHAKEKDTDLEPLHEDERWAKVMAKYEPDPKPVPEPKKDDGGKKAGDEKKDGEGK